MIRQLVLVLVLSVLVTAAAPAPAPLNEKQMLEMQVKERIKAREAVQKLRVSQAELFKKAAFSRTTATDLTTSAQKLGIQASFDEKQKTAWENKELALRKQLTADESTESDLKAKIAEVHSLLNDARLNAKLLDTSYIKQNKAAKALEIKARGKLNEVENAKGEFSVASRKLTHSKNRLLNAQKKTDQARDSLLAARKELADAIISKKKMFREGRVKAREHFLAMVEEERKAKADHEQDARKAMELEIQKLEENLAEKKQKINDDTHDAHEQSHKCKAKLRNRLKEELRKAEEQRITVLEDAHRALNNAPNAAEAQNVNNKAHQKVLALRKHIESERQRLTAARKTCRTELKERAKANLGRKGLLSNEFHAKVKDERVKFRNTMQQLSEALRAEINQLFEARKEHVEQLAKEFYDNKALAEKNVADKMAAFDQLKKKMDDRKLSVGHRQSLFDEAEQKLNSVKEAHQNYHDLALQERTKADKLKTESMEAKKRIMILEGQLALTKDNLAKMQRKEIQDQKLIDESVAKAKEFEVAMEKSQTLREEEEKKAEAQLRLADEDEQVASAMIVPTLPDLPENWVQKAGLNGTYDLIATAKGEAPQPAKPIIVSTEAELSA